MGRSTPPPNRSANEMNTHKHPAVAYRARAEELRAIAEQMKDAETKRILTETAEEYDRMAARAHPRRPDR